MTATTAVRPDLVEALEDFATAFSEGVAADIATSLTCTEVEALANLYRALGDDSTAQTWIVIHAEGDDQGDEHYIKPTHEEA